MKYFGLVLIWLVAFTGSFLWFSVGLIQADPADDFSLTLERTSQQTYSLMPELRVEQILRDRLTIRGVGLVTSPFPQLARHLLSLCQLYRFDPAFILALIEVESSFRSDIVSTHGAVGLMQVMPATATMITQEWGLQLPQGFSLKEPFTNLTIGIAYLALLRDRYHDLLPYYLLAAYNAGPGKLRHLRENKGRPEKLKIYFEAIKRELPGFRFYRGQLNV